MRVVDAHPLQVTNMTFPVRIALHMSFGLVQLHPLALAVMPGTDDDVILCSTAASRKGLLGLG